MRIEVGNARKRHTHELDRRDAVGREVERELLNSIIELAPQSALLDIAAGLDHERKSKSRGPLHGIPILVKDSIATDPALGMETTAGSFALVGARVLGDHPAVGRVSLDVAAAALVTTR